MSKHIFMASFIFLVLVHNSWSQNTPSGDPVPGSLSWSQQDSRADQQDADSRGQADATENTSAGVPISGAEQIGPYLSTRDNSLQPTFSFSQRADSNPSSFGTSSRWALASTIGASLDLKRKGRWNEFDAKYQGMGLFYETRSGLNSVPRNSSFQDLFISQRLNWRHWSLLIGDQMSFSPDADFGFGGLGGFGIGGPLSNFDAGFNPGFVPNQTVLTPRSSRISNAALTQIEYRPTHRSSITATGSYGLLHFFKTGAIDGNQINAQSGYNYFINPHNTVGFDYAFSSFRFPGQKVETNALDLNYSHRILDRLSWQIGGGPEFVTLTAVSSHDVFVFFNGQLIRFVGVSRTTNSSVFGRGFTSLSYAWPTTTATLRLRREVTGGSGVLAGAKSTIAELAISRILTQRWNGSINLGYSQNVSLSVKQRFNTIYLGAAVHRSLGHSAGFFFNYTLERQNNKLFCTGCDEKLLRHVIGIGYDWAPRPMRVP
jgi:hypothetical protein